MTLLFFSDIPWEHLYQRPQQLATRLAQHWPVVWIEPVTLGYSRKWKPVRLHDGLHALSLPQFPHNARNRYVRAVSRFISQRMVFRALLNRVQAFFLRRAMRTLGVQTDQTIALVENFQFIDLVRRIDPGVMLFDYIDDAFGFARFPPYVYSDWKKTIDRADTITVTTGFLKKQIESARPGSIHIVGNAVDTTLFMRSAHEARPSDLPPSGMPLIGYVGTISHWFDFTLLEIALRQLPDYAFVLIGPAHPSIQRRLTQLRGFTNFRFLGPRPYQDIPIYLRACTVGIIPFVRNRLTEAVNPVKLYEYAAAGLPIVTTAFSDDLEQFADVTYISRTSGEFVAFVYKAVARARDMIFVERLRGFARQNDWSARAQTIASLLTQMTDTRDFTSPRSPLHRHGL